MSDGLKLEMSPQERSALRNKETKVAESEKQLREAKKLLKDIYDYFDVENEGVTANVYKLCERIRNINERED